MFLRSYSFKEGKEIPRKFTCDGGNCNPPLVIEDVPPGTESLVLIVDDPTAIGGGTFTHWVIWNISPKTAAISESEIPMGAVQGKNDFGDNGWGGPCPPRGNPPHRYEFKLYALKKNLDLRPGATKETVERAMQGYILEEAKLIGFYQRKI